MEIKSLKAEMMDEEEIFQLKIKWFLIGIFATIIVSWIIRIIIRGL